LPYQKAKRIRRCHEHGSAFRTIAHHALPATSYKLHAAHCRCPLPTAHCRIPPSSEIENGIVQAIYVVRNPDKLKHLTSA
jgi:hypothetical protein